MNVDLLLAPQREHAVNLLNSLYVNGVDKREVPISVLEHISVQLIDGTNITINIKDLISEGQDPHEIETMLDEKFNELDHYIKNVDFFVDIDKVKDAVQPETDKVLKGL